MLPDLHEMLSTSAGLQGCLACLSFRSLNFSFPRMKKHIFHRTNTATKQEEGLVKQILDVVKGSIMHQWIQFIEQRASVLDEVSFPHRALKHALTE